MSMNYRSVVVYGRFETVPEDDKASALAALMEHLAPGRQGLVRPGDATELAATTVLRLSLAEAAAKVRNGPPIDDGADMALSVWAGVLPLHTVAGAPQADPAGAPHSAADAPEHVRRWLDRSFTPD